MWEGPQRPDGRSHFDLSHSSEELRPFRRRIALYGCGYGLFTKSATSQSLSANRLVAAEVRRLRSGQGVWTERNARSRTARPAERSGQSRRTGGRSGETGAYVCKARPSALNPGGANAAGLHRSVDPPAG